MAYVCGMWAAFGGKGANYPSQDSRISVFVAKKHSGARNFACGANYLAPGWFKFCLRRKPPAPGTKGGLFCIFAILYLCGE